MMKYYYAINNQKKGPFSIDELKKHNLNENTLVWYNGLKKWKMLKNVPELQNVLKQKSRTKYYLLEDNNKTGPFYLDDLEEKNITPTTMVWYNSLDQWAQAKDIDELEQFIMPALPSELQEEKHTTNNLSSAPDLPKPKDDDVKLPDDISLIYMPRFSDTVETAVISKWIKKEGDKVSKGDIIAEIETDKATMEFESFHEGTILHIALEEGEQAITEALICVISEHEYDKNEILQILERENLLQNPEENPPKIDAEFDLLSDDEQQIDEEEDYDEEVDDYEYDDYDYEVDNESEDYFTDEKECIFCKETIKANAEICKYCNNEQISEEELELYIKETKPFEGSRTKIYFIVWIGLLIESYVNNTEKPMTNFIINILIVTIIMVVINYLLGLDHYRHMKKLTPYQLIKKYKEIKKKQKRNKIIWRIVDIIIVIIVLFVLYVFISNS